MDSKLFAGRFEIEGLLGSGGMGSVYLAHHVVLQRRFAIKVLTGDSITEAAMARFRREARAASRVHHRNVTAVVDFGHTDEGKPYLVMEYAEGLNLQQLVAELGPLPLRRALNLLAQVAEALAAAHATGVIHRDLKSENIVLTSEDQRDVAKVLDFGLATIASEQTHVSFKGEVVGTPSYMAPEQCLGKQTDHRTDIYSFGALAFELFVGRPPFVGSLMEQVTATIKATPQRVSEASSREDVGPELDKLVARCLAKKPEERPQSAVLLAQQLRAHLRATVAERPAAEEDDDATDEVTRTSTSGVLDWASSELTDADWTRTEADWTYAEVTSAEPIHGRPLEDIAFAARDLGLGTPTISYALAAKLRAEDEAYRLHSELQLLDTIFDGIDRTSRERELRLGQALSQLEHERQAASANAAAAPDVQKLDQTIGDLAEQIGKVQQGAQAQRKQLKRQIARLSRRLAASHRRVADQEARLATLLKQVDASALARVAEAAPLEVLESFDGQDAAERRRSPSSEERAFRGPLQLPGLLASPAAAAPPQRLKQEVKRIDATTTLLRLSGTVDEGSQLGRLAGEVADGATVVIDPSEVQRLTSPGIRDWIGWLERLEAKRCETYFVECPPSIIANAGDVEGFFGGGQIVSFWAPYFCPSCDTEALLLIAAEETEATDDSRAAPVCYCDKCDYSVMEFDDIESSYFAFLQGRATPELSTALADSVSKVTRSSPGDLIPTDKLAARDAVSGNLPDRAETETTETRLRPPRKSRLNVEIEPVEEGATQLALSGVIDEYNGLDKVLGQIPAETRTVLLETSDVQRINSCGVRDWIALLKELDSRGCQYLLLDCAPAIMTQVRLVPGFLGNGEIVTFFAPYFCTSCEADKMLRVSVEQAHAAGPFQAPECRCDECNNPMEFDDIESSYFAFLHNSPPTSITDKLAETLRRRYQPSRELVLPIPTIQTAADSPPSHAMEAGAVGRPAPESLAVPPPVSVELDNEPTTADETFPTKADTDTDAAPTAVNRPTAGGVSSGSTAAAERPRAEPRPPRQPPAPRPTPPCQPAPPASPPPQSRPTPRAGSDRKTDEPTIVPARRASAHSSRLLLLIIGLFGCTLAMLTYALLRT